MKLLDQLQRRFGRFALPHVTEGLIACQVLAYLLDKTQPTVLGNIALLPERVLHGEVWRLVTFLGEPPTTNLVFAFFFWYLFFLMGTALESTWGALRYNVYLLVGWAATVAASFLQPQAPAAPGFLQGSVFLAFAYLYPEFQLLLFFILPVKVKWLAILAWIGYFCVAVFGTLATQLLVTASVLNFFLFFWHDIALRVRSGHWQMAHQARQIRRAERAPPHVRRLWGNEPQRSEDELPLLLEVCRRAVLLRRTHPRARARHRGECLRPSRHAESAR